MRNVSDWIQSIQSGEQNDFFSSLYPDSAARQPARAVSLLAAFGARFGYERPVRLVSAPGRTELGGNHTDHQQGRVLAAALTLDMLAVVSPRDDSRVRFVSRGFPDDELDLRDRAARREERNTSAALIRGVAARFDALGYAVGGFDACQESAVPGGSGMSSSAAFEVLIGGILNTLYNENRIPPETLALIGQYAENHFFGKPCGLMDQTASAVGSVVAIDFAHPEAPAIERIKCDFSAGGYTLCILNAGGSHADLTDEYAAIPGEMQRVAALLGAPVLGAADPGVFARELPALRGQVPDRALLRALHFFGENRRVALEADALRSGDYAMFRTLMKESGRSSFERLQNVFPANDPAERSVALALALCEEELGATGGGWRVHGGGFAGTVQALVPAPQVPAFTARMQAVFGAGCCLPVAVRPRGIVDMFTHGGT